MSSEESAGTSRSGFLKRAAGATIAVAGAGVGAAAFAERAAAATPLTGGDFVPAHRFSIEIDGVNCGVLGGVDGGASDYDVVLDALGPDHIVHKHLGQPKYEDFSIQVGSGMSKPMYDWIKASFDKGGAAVSGAIVSMGDSNEEIARREFSQALVTSVTFPALDSIAGRKGNFTVTFSAPSVSDGTPSGKPVDALKQKAWLCSNFKIKIDGLSTSRVSKIESFTIKQKVVQDSAGVSRNVVGVGDLSVTFPPAGLASWQQWYDNIGVDPTDERSGTLVVTGAPGGAVLSLGLSNLGLYQLKSETDNVAGQAIKRFNAELYCEELQFTYSGGWAA